MANVWSYNFNWNLISQKNELISSCCLLNNKNNNIANKNNNIVVFDNGILYNSTM